MLVLLNSVQIYLIMGLLITMIAIKLFAVAKKLAYRDNNRELIMQLEMIEMQVEQNKVGFMGFIILSAPGLLLAVIIEYIRDRRA